VPSFIISNYKTESYLSEIKKQGLQKRKKSAGRRNHRLHALMDEERQCAKSLCLDLSQASKYTGLVRAFIQKESFPMSQWPDEEMAQKLQEKLMKLQKSELDRIIEKMGEVDTAEMHELTGNLTVSLLYENAAEGIVLESTLTTAKRLGLQKRKEAAKMSKRKDYRLHSLTVEELQCTKALGLDLSNISQYICLVETYLQRRQFSELQLENTSKQERSLKEKLVKLQKNDLADVVAQMDQSSSSDLLNLTECLLYEIAVEEAGLEMYILIVLPHSRLIIGEHSINKTSCVSSKNQVCPEGMQ